MRPKRTVKPRGCSLGAGALATVEFMACVIGGPAATKRASAVLHDAGRLRALECAKPWQVCPSSRNTRISGNPSPSRSTRCTFGPRHEAVAPMLGLLDQIRERVDDETWGLIVDFEWRSSREVVTGIEIGLELGFDHGRTSALVEAEEVSGKPATILVARLADLLGDTEAGHFDVLLALLAALRATVMAVRCEEADG